MAQGIRILIRALVVLGGVVGPLVLDGPFRAGEAGRDVGLSAGLRVWGGGLAWADSERMRLEPGERERLRGELREQPWYRGHGRRMPFPPGPPADELAPRGPVDGPHGGFAPHGRRGEEFGPPGPWPGVRMSPDERRELRRQLRENPPGQWGGTAPVHQQRP